MLTSYDILNTEAAKIAAAGGVAHERLKLFFKTICEAQECELKAHEERVNYLKALAKQTLELTAIIEGKDAPEPEAVAETPEPTKGRKPKLVEPVEPSAA